MNKERVSALLEQTGSELAAARSARWRPRVQRLGTSVLRYAGSLCCE